MTKEQAFKNLSLPADADVETIRLCFAAVYTLSDVQYDRTLTEGMKEVHEKHLRELEQAYKTITDDPVIADMGALLSLGKGYIEEKDNTIGSDNRLSTNEALAFFALYSYDSPLLAEQRYKQYLEELEEAIEKVGLEASKEPFRQEIEKANYALQVAINYLLANHLLEANQENEEQDEPQLIAESSIDTETQELILAEPAPETASKPVKSKKIAIYGVAVIALIAIAYFLINQNTTKNNPAVVITENQMDSIAWEAALAGNNIPAYQNYLDKHPKGSFAKEAKALIKKSNKQSVAMPKEELIQKTEIVEVKTPKEEITTSVALTPIETIRTVLKKYAPDYKIDVKEKERLIKAEKGEERWTIPLYAVESINSQGQFVSKSNSQGFIFQGKNGKKTSENFRLIGATRIEKEHLIEAIHTLALFPKENKVSINSPELKKDTLLDNVNKPIKDTIKNEKKVYSSL